MSKIVTYGTNTLDFDALPEASLMAMLKRGVTHFLGSEQASKVTALFDPDRKLADGETRLDDNEENRAKAKAEFVADAIRALNEGTVGVSTRGPSVDPVTAKARTMAREEVRTTLTANDVKWPKKAEDTVTFPNGSAFTVNQLIDRRLAHAEHGPRIQAAATKEVAAEAKAKAKKIEQAKSTGLADL